MSKKRNSSWTIEEIGLLKKLRPKLSIAEVQLRFQKQLWHHIVFQNKVRLFLDLR